MGAYLRLGDVPIARGNGRAGPLARGRQGAPPAALLRPGEATAGGRPMPAPARARAAGPAAASGRRVFLAAAGRRSPISHGEIGLSEYDCGMMTDVSSLPLPKSASDVNTAQETQELPLGCEAPIRLGVCVRNVLSDAEAGALRSLEAIVSS
eukprot:scaffold39_cov493-Prasinococcus_capsulatus_cf.AAC.5